MLGVKPVCTPDPHMPMLPLGATTGTPPEAWREMVCSIFRDPGPPTKDPEDRFPWLGEGPSLLAPL